jgi:predicted methyltransferase
MKSLALLLALATWSFACKRREEPATAPQGSGSAPAVTAVATADAGMSDSERVAKRIAENEASAAKERERFTPELEQAALALRDRELASTGEAMAAILESEHRVPAHRERDVHRHPRETLEFFQITPSSRVIELGAGGGWYTELLAPLLARKGKLSVAGPAGDGPPDQMATAYGKALDSFLAKSKLFEKVERLTVSKPLQLGPDGAATHVIAIREIHNWQRRDDLDTYLAAIHAALEDGGTFGVVAHRGKPDTKGEDTAESGYLAEAWVVAKVEAAGFKLAERSEINANPKDTKDHPKGVWNLPPNFRDGDTDRDKYAAIGESDRMTLRFTKVAK